MKSQYDFPIKYGSLIKLNNFKNLEVGEKVSAAGRIIFDRDLGKIVFYKIADQDGIVQFSISADNLAENFNNYKTIKRGDIVAISGETYNTNSGELTIRVEELFLLNSALRTLGNKWHGAQDTELKLRYRYMDMLQDEKLSKTLKLRLKLIRSIRRVLESMDFVEVETPILQNVPSGAAAKPFLTYHEALNMPVYLRIAPELYLKMLVIGGYNRVFEIGKNFRNEGSDATHLQEFTMLEFYSTYKSYEESKDFVISFLQKVISEIYPSKIVGDIDFNNIEKISYTALLEREGINWKNKNSVLEAAIKFGLTIEDYKSSQALLDAVYKRAAAWKIQNPILVYDYPRSALAKVSDKDPQISDQFQVIVKGREIIKSYLELNDSIQQRSNFEEQSAFQKAGDDETIRTDEEFIRALEFGLPPTLGFGMGIDRLVGLLTDTEHLKNTIFFPLLRPQHTQEN